MRSKFACYIFFVFWISCETSQNKKGVNSDIPYWPPEKILNAGFLVMDGVYNSELTAPMDILQHSKYRHSNFIEVFTVAQKMDTTISFEGLKIIPDYTFENHPKIDVLVVPSAEHHLDSDLENEQMISWVKDQGEQATWVMSLCDGAFVLAKAGLLDEKNCTTFPSDIDQLQKDFPSLNTHKDVLFVHDGKFITSVGGARSFEPALYLHHILYGDSLTKQTANGLVLNWDIGQMNFLRF